MIEESRIPLDTIKEICKQSGMWELDNPRVIGMMNRIKFTKEDYAKRHHSGYLGQKAKE